MLILGVSDGDDPSVCLVRDNQVVAVERASGLVGGQRQHGFPWRAAEVALERIEASKADVGLVGVAGRFSPHLSCVAYRSYGICCKIRSAQ